MTYEYVSITLICNDSSSDFGFDNCVRPVNGLYINEGPAVLREEREVVLIRNEERRR